MGKTEVERYNGVDVEDVPSAQWGWSTENPRVLHIIGIFAALFMLALTHGNHVGHVEDVFLILFAVVIAGTVARDWIARSCGWYR
ncbi:DUF2631 domain-containing protein [Mycobacterium adipatum]|uniref:DUF2631 domain-containing protein n=1 Tax=Mycobacterium adipatum TaxID=1682113 RepID=UPI0034E0A330